MSMEKTISTGRLQDLMTEIMVLRTLVEQAERHQLQSVVQTDRLLKSRKIQTAADATIPAAS